MSKRKTTEEFIQDAVSIHGDRYNYSKVEYVGAHAKICIICPEHGEFWQRAEHHLNKSGCPECSHKHKPTTEEFIQKARTVHGDKYDYSKVSYKNNYTKVCIICPEHGKFWKSAEKHIRGKYVCPKCSKQRKPTIEEFIQKARKVHGDKYDYSKVEYINSQTKICIICPEHGEFWQRPNGHISNKGCPKCKISKGNKAVAKWLDDHRFKYDKEKTFDKCRDIGLLPFDFYIPSQNTLIEYDGKQHYKPIEFFGGNKAFIDRQKKDNIKTKYCGDNNIQLIRIRYDEDIESMMNNLLSK